MSANWGQARIEVDALREEILNRLASGESIRSVFLDLRSTGRITINERPFYYRVKNLKQQHHQEQTTRAQTGTGSAPHNPVETLSVGRAASPSTPISATARPEAARASEEPELGKRLVIAEGRDTASLWDDESEPSTEKDD